MADKKPGIALISIGLGPKLKKAGPKGMAPERESESDMADDGADKMSYFKDFKAALKDNDDEAAAMALEGFVSCCSHESEGGEED